MPKIVMLRGNSGSGKSTTAMKLKKELGHEAILISQDYIRREMLSVKDTPNNKSIDLLMNLVCYGHKNFNYIILEGILRSDIYEKLFHFVAKLFHGQVYAYYFDVPFEETLLRHKQKTNSHEFGESEMKKWWINKDYLHIDGLFERTITKDMNLTETVDFICSHFTKS